MTRRTRRRSKKRPERRRSSTKKRTSGNNVRNKQSLYLLWNFPFIWIVKIGITGRGVWNRCRAVDKEDPGITFPIFWVNVPFAYQLEQFIFKICKSLNLQYKNFGGTGHTERFWVPAILVYFPIAIGALVLYYTFNLLIVAAIFFWLYMVAKTNENENEKINEGRDYPRNETSRSVYPLRGIARPQHGDPEERRSTERGRLFEVEENGRGQYLLDDKVTTSGSEDQRQIRDDLPMVLER